MDKVGKQTLEVMGSARWYNQWLFDKIKPHLGKKILEVGGGIGNFSKMLSETGAVTAIDINSDYVSKGKKIKEVTYGFGDIEKAYYFKDLKDFSSIVCFNVLEHIKNDNKALRNMNTLLEKGGSVLLIVPAHQWLYSHFDKELGHYRRYTVTELRKKLHNAGFTVRKVSYLNWWAAVGWWVFIRVFRPKNMPKSPVGIFDTFGKYFLWPENYIAPPFGLSVFAIAEK